MTASNVEIIVLDWDGGELLNNCLHSIDRQSLRPARIILFDNGSRVPVYQRLVKTEVPVKLLRSTENLGFTGGINKAMSEVKAPYVAWVNNDVVLSAKWLEKLLPALAEDETVAAAQTVNLYDKTFVDGAGITIQEGVFRQIGHGERLDKVRLQQPWGISATAALFRTAALKSVAVNGLILRNEFFAYYEDVELSARLRARDWKFKIVPEPLAIHRGSSSASRLGREGFRMRIRNRYRVARLHKGVGQISAFIAEDVSAASKDLISGNFKQAGLRLGSVIQGLTG